MKTLVIVAAVNAVILCLGFNSLPLGQKVATLTTLSLVSFGSLKALKRV